MSRKLGSGALEAFARQGLKEVGAALRPLQDSIQIDEVGTLGNLTPQEVMETKQKDQPQRAVDMDMDK